MRPTSDQSGFTIIELMVSMTLLMIVSGTVLTGVLDMTRVNDVVTNRTDMHNGVRNATELLTQEVGQAGRISLPAGVKITADTAVHDTTIHVSSVDQMFPGELLILGTEETQETVVIGPSASDIDAANLTVNLAVGLDFVHLANAPLRVAGGFAAGVLPNSGNGSSATTLKIFGDINGDGTGNGKMVYVEYWCDIDNATKVGRLYRNSMPFNQVGKTQPTVEQVLIDNIKQNPPNQDGSITPCFTYQTQTVNGTTFVVDVAITLTVQTQKVDPITKERQTETKALLNVSPRNVFNVWQLASLGVTNRVQPTPPTVTALLP